MRRSWIVLLFIGAALLGLGYVMGYFSQLYISPLQSKANSLFEKRFPSTHALNGCSVMIPVRFLSGKTPDGRLAEQQGELKVKSNDIALILVDTWGAQRDTTRTVRHIAALLSACRKHHITIIHAPNYPVVEKYDQYFKIRKIVRLATAQYYSRRFEMPFLNWPPGDNYAVKQSRKLRATVEKRVPQKSWHKRKIITALKPRESEFVVQSYEELRYVLYKRKINTLFYAGMALNECILHRETGIYRMSGIGDEPVPFTIVVFEDCVKAMPTLTYDDKAMKQAMLEYYKIRLAFISQSSKLSFQYEKTDTN